MYNLGKFFESMGLVQFKEGYSGSFIKNFTERKQGFTDPGLYVMTMRGKTTPLM
jgi:hypothetical protein